MLYSQTTPTSLSLSEQRLLLIEEQLAHGWQLQLPILARAAFNTRHGRMQVFEFILCDRQGRQVAIAVPDEPGVDRFLRKYALDVVEVA